MTYLVGHRTVLTGFTVVVAVVLGLSSLALSDPKVGLVLFAAGALTIAALVTCVTRPALLIPLFMVTLIAAPTIQIGGIAVSLSDAVAAGALLGLPFIPEALQNLRKPIGLTAVAWLVAMALSLIAPLLAGKGYALVDGLKLLRIAGVVLPILLWRKVSMDLGRISGWLLAAGAVSCAIGIIAFGSDLLSGLAGKQAGQFIFLPGQVMSRATGLYGEAGSFGDVGAIVVLLAWFKLREKRSTLTTLLSLVAAGLGALALVEAYSRSSLLFLAAALAVALIAEHRSAGAALGVAGVLLACWIAVSTLQPDLTRAFVVDRVGAGLAGNVDYTSGRLSNWPAIFSLYASDPTDWALGLGYKSLSSDSGNPLGSLPGDNNYLTAVAETGIMGLATMIGFLVALGVFLRSAPRSRLRSAALGIYGGVLAQSFFVDVMTYHRVLGILVLMGALLPAREEAATRQSRTYQTGIVEASAVASGSGQR